MMSIESMKQILVCYVQGNHDYPTFHPGRKYSKIASQYFQGFVLSTNVCLFFRYEQSAKRSKSNRINLSVWCRLTRRHHLLGTYAFNLLLAGYWEDLSHSLKKAICLRCIVKWAEFVPQEFPPREDFTAKRWKDVHYFLKLEFSEIQIQRKFSSINQRKKPTFPGKVCFFPRWNGPHRE